MNNPFNKNQGEDFVEGVVNDYENDEYSEVSEQSLWRCFNGIY